ncbi:unnamed protein product, partial [Amoebophrya sp. A25]
PAGADLSGSALVRSSSQFGSPQDDFLGTQMFRSFEQKQQDGTPEEVQVASSSNGNAGNDVMTPFVDWQLREYDTLGGGPVSTTGASSLSTPPYVESQLLLSAEFRDYEREQEEMKSVDLAGEQSVAEGEGVDEAGAAGAGASASATFSLEDVLDESGYLRSVVTFRTYALGLGRGAKNAADVKGGGPTIWDHQPPVMRASSLMARFFRYRDSLDAGSTSGDLFDGQLD